ncbi:AAA family ATPase [Planktothrix sp. FACHB-1355]|uniref:AAA family ATPase n=1 Tax=Aerosakkonema funiforme FACHB-1375 TaxID=2949571 RepID=A0A926VGG1_9CYAN|nr:MULTISPECIES: AAA family ATPase [Oscillatoriales]MBD2183391.1 AAA family ATPase [Aerosakkonema funiforme FACHB-1375]MBD3557485.1 AAA family ATPase [Planktothrix sp. FACHB-1355]
MLLEKKAEFVRLFQEFVTSYPSTPAGLRHTAAYNEQRQQGKRNFEAISSAFQSGEDVTEAVLLQMLPYTDSDSNRQRHAWIHIAPALATDVRIKFEASGWTKSEHWNLIAQAIFKFISSCYNDPIRLSNCCQEFSENSYSKGFQAGTLSPILNALRPDNFLLINKKSLEVINYFANTSYSQKLTDYPEINTTGRKLIQELAHNMHIPGIPALRDDDLFDMFCHWLVAIKKYSSFRTRYWKIAPGENAWQWEECLNGGFIAIGWEELGDISGLSRAEFDSQRDELIAQYPEKWTKSGVNQVWVFAQIQKGDRIIANRGTQEVLGIGTVTGSYYFVPNVKHGHRLPVHWDSITPHQVNEKGWLRTVIEIGQEKFDTICNPSPGGGPFPPSIEKNPEYTLAQCAEDTGIEEETLKFWLQALERTKQAIFYGPPGTGKTYIAKKLAKHLIGGGDGFMDVVQFHPAYAYEDFVQGIRPQRKNGELDYPLVDGRFLEFCQKAGNCQNICVLIIDEINRANVARVFGELMYLLEYRQEEISLASGKVFSIPDNVRIIGTMNTADRSIALVDHALRRRFAFISLYPNYEILLRYHVSSEFPVKGLIQLLKQLNQQIGNPHYEIGISFFLRPNITEQIESIWRLEIEPYLEEYFFDQPSKVNQFRWDKVKQQVFL